jgi:hypothetical protein
MARHEEEAVMEEPRTESRLAAAPQHLVVQGRNPLTIPEDQLLVLELAQAHPLSGSESVRVADGDREAFPVEADELEPGFDGDGSRIRKNEERRVERPVAQHARLSVPLRRLDVDLDLRGELVKSVQNPRRHGCEHQGGSSDAKPASLAVADLTDAKHRLIGEIDHAVRLAKQPLAGGGQVNPPRRAVEQSEADLALDPRDHHADGRLRNTQPSSRAAEVELFCDGDESSQMAQVEIDTARI